MRLKEGGWREGVCNGSREGKLGVGGLTPVPPWCLGILTLSLLVVFKWRFEESRQPAEPDQAAYAEGSSLLKSDLAVVDTSDPRL